jgi:large subunit ribosomal protein L13
MKTFSPTPKDLTRKWYLIDASELPLGRMATTVARLLIGKDKPTFAPHVDGGDFVVVVNAGLLRVSGTKERDKVYHRHSGFPGGLHKRTLGEQRELNPAKVVEHAVRGMLPDNKLRAPRLKRLKVYADANHLHAAQGPIAVSSSKDSK